jgi:hypothetical protein
MTDIIRLTQIDGKLPNLALMRLSAFHKARGDEIHFSRSPYRGMFEPAYDKVYGSAIFDFSAPRVAILRAEFPGAIIGGSWNENDTTTVESVLDPGTDTNVHDYSLYPDFTASIGFTARGCRFKCGFCSVPKREGAPRPVNTITDIWRGEPHPRHLHLLDNDFFGQSREQWETRITEIRDGNFKVCFNQGINIRMIDDRSAAALASVRYHDDSFKVRRLYTAWDNVGHEAKFFRGIECLERAGIPSSHVMAYMLVGYDPHETWERVMYRFDKMTALNIRPYPMIFQQQKNMRLPLGGHNARLEQRTLGEFQRWAIRKAYTFIPFEHYDVNAKGHIEQRQESLFA